MAKNAQYGSLKLQIPPLIYIPYNQGSPILPNEMTFVLRTKGDPLAYVNSVREVVHQADSRLPISNVRTQKLEVEDGMHEEAVLAELCTAFAILALTIASVGLYGTISSGVARRTGEIGIRIALGARRGPAWPSALDDPARGITTCLGWTRNQHPHRPGDVEVSPVLFIPDEAERSVVPGGRGGHPAGSGPSCRLHSGPPRRLHRCDDRPSPRMNGPRVLSFHS